MTPVRVFTAALTALVFVIESARGAVPREQPSAGTAASTPEEKDGPCQAILKFATDRFGAPDASGVKDLNDLGFPCRVPTNQRLNFLIATIPDPIATHLQLWFDRAVESIQSAAGFVGFRFEDAWIPWDADLVREEPDIEKRNTQQNLLRLREKEPGVMLFRGPKCQSGEYDESAFYCRDLVVLLVPETPTAGISQDVFQAAAAIALSSSQGLQTADSKIPVLGPSFSGSFSSLEKIMAAPSNLRDRLRVISGTAATSRTWVPAFIGTKSSYNATVHTIDEQFSMLQSIVDTRRKKDSRIGLLTESETQLGWHFADPKTDVGERIVFRYPREISRLRNAYGDQELKTVVGAQQPTPAFKRILGFRLFDIGPSTDNTPTMSPIQTPLSQDAVLREIARTLQRERITLAGIVATDVFDALFIMRYLRDACPDVRLFTFDSDLLYIKGAEDFPFNGSMAISTYPLLPSNQTWTNLHRTSDGGKLLNERILFASRAAEGIYNAMRVLLVRSNYVSEDLKKEELAEYFDPSSNCPSHASSVSCATPPLWLTVVTRTGYWPLAITALRDPSQAESVDTKKFIKDTSQRGRMISWPSPDNQPNFGLNSPPRLWFLFSILLVLALGWHFISQLLACATPLGERPGFAHLNLWPREPGVHARLCYLLVCSVSLIACYGIYILPLMAIGVYRDSAGLVYARWLYAIPFVAFALCACAPLLKARRVFSDIRARKVGWPEAWHFAILVLTGVLMVVVAVGAIWLFPLSPYSNENQEAFFRAYRALQLDSGVSPILPLLALTVAFFGWGRVHLTRITMRFERITCLPKLGKSKELEALSTCQRRIEELVNEPLPLHWRTAGSFALAMGVVLFLGHALTSLEPDIFDQLFLLLLAVLYALLFLTWMRFILIWKEFHRFLQRLGQHPIRFAFSDLPAGNSISPFLQFSREKQFEVLVAVRDSLRMLVKGWYSGLEDESAIFDDNLDRVLAAATNGIVVRQSGATDLLASLGRINNDTVDKLSRGRWLEGHSERKLAANGDGAPDSLTPDQLREEIIALQYRDYIHYVVRHQQNLLIFVIVGFLLSMGALHVYPFQSPRTVTSFITIMFLLFGAGVIAVMAQADRDQVLSRITKTTPDKLSSGFFFKVAGYLGLPLVTVLGSQFPNWGRILFSWVQPLLEAMK